jgi:hypothetical protein
VPVDRKKKAGEGDCIQQEVSLYQGGRTHPPGKFVEHMTQLTNGSIVVAWSDKSTEMFEEFEEKVMKGDKVGCGPNCCAIF